MNSQLKIPTRANLSRTGRMLQIAADHYKGAKNIPEPVRAVIQAHKQTRLSSTFLAKELQGGVS